MNPMLSNLNQNRLLSNIQPVRDLMNMVKNASNPQMMMQQMMMRNPQIKQIMDYVNQNGGDFEQAFYKRANEMGINPDDILKELR